MVLHYCGILSSAKQLAEKGLGFYSGLAST